MKKPGMVTAIGGMRLGSGCFNILTALGFFWLVYPLLLIPLGIIEIINGANLLKEKPEKIKWLKGLAILEIVAVVALSFPSLVVGILTLVFLGREDVQGYFASAGAEGFEVPAEPAAPAQAPPASETPPAESQPPTEPPA